MTKEEAKKMLTNTKVYVNGKSKQIQEKLFEIGFLWKGNEEKEISHMAYPFLYLTEYITCNESMLFFKDSPLKEISAEDILNIKLDEEFIPKHGDIIFVKSGDSSFIEIFDSYKDYGLTNKFIWCSYYISLGVPFSVNESGGYLFKDDIDEIRLANVYERNLLFYALKEKGLVWNEEKKEVEKIEQPKKEHVFKPFDKVLARDFEDDKWEIDFFEKINDDDEEFTFNCLSENWTFCVPYEGNEGLLDTSNSPKL